MKDNKAIALAVLEKIGGKENIVRCFHCVTRLRFELKDESLVDKAAIQAIPGVVTLKIVGHQYQVVIGPNVGDVYAELCAAAGISEEAAIDEKLDQVDEKAEESKDGKFSLGGIANAVVQSVVNSVIPALPILTGGGMLKVIAMLLIQFGIMTADNSTYQVLYNVGECAFYFLPIYVAMNAAKHFKTSVPLATMLAAFLILPAFTNGVAEGTMTTIFGLPITKAGYTSTVLPAILVTWILSYVHGFINKWCPKVVATVFVPTLTLLIMVPLAICLLGPAGAVLGNYMATALMWIYNTFGWFGMGIMGALRPLLIFTGMHTALIPFAIQTLTESGYETFFMVTGMGYVFGSAAACLAVGLKAKKVENKSSAFGCASTALIGGITEPSLYGVLMKYTRPLIAVMIGNFVSGAYFGLTHTYVYAMPGSTGIFGIPALIGPTSANLVNGLIALGLSMVVAFVLTFIFGIKED